jgi:diguanylate cyclase (GGDEF)-like protein/PAS domain S-box-containing protein
VSQEISYRDTSTASIESFTCLKQLKASVSAELRSVLLDHLLAENAHHLIVLDKEGIIVWTSMREGDTRRSGQQEAKPLLVAHTGEPFTELFRRTASLGDDIAAEALAGVLDVIEGRKGSFEMDYPCVGRKELCWYRMRVVSLPQRPEIVVSYHDVSDRKRLEHELRRYRKLFSQEKGLHNGQGMKGNNGRRHSSPIGPWFRDSVFKQAAAVFLNSSESVVITDANLQIVNVNEGFINTTGFSYGEVIGGGIGLLGLDCFADEASDMDICRSVRIYGHWQGELKTYRSNKDSFYSWTTVDVVLDEDGNPENYIFVFSDITSIKESQARIHYLAHHDPLTGLANRLLFWALLEQAIAHAERHGTKVALVCIDIDDFKSINDRMGHPVGDQLLKVIAERLTNEVREDDTIARMGGDEFALIAEDISSHADMEVFVNKLKKKLAEEVLLDEISVKPSASMGYALFPDEGQTPENLYKVADKLMYKNKVSNVELAGC